MKHNDKQKDHPEVTEVKNICDISSETKHTKDICEKVKKHKKSSEEPAKK
ncbi:hypothetical protein [Legionella cardiaca]|uniref:Uncharacterized protein n=1 Tax=Legionella cardiaca TaxID=1071983 RepID=A0ABY8AQK7_9GAMM|nr:hypothetical protein [Legionella cardiaca]WED42061.1 hypothetical protein PXX05_08955 [Legionella cardiaca]